MYTVDSFGSSRIFLLLATQHGNQMKHLNRQRVERMAQRKDFLADEIEGGEKRRYGMFLTA